ncbi:MAG: cytochrome P450 [Gammaproteobacteria bacterium]|nr:cytochrome P450 [Gammaproteobacteria bacterium]
MNISELTLPELDITSPEFAEDPFPPYEKAIEQHWLARAAVGYVVLGFNDMRELLLMDDKLDTPNKAITTLMGAEDSIWGKWNNRFMLALSGDDHKRIRGLVAPTFTPRNAELHRPVMKETVNGLLDDWAAKERFDFAEFASFFPISVMCRLIGAPVGAVPQIKDKLEAMGAGFSLNPDILPELDDALEYMMDFVDKLFKEREANPRREVADKDLMDQLLEVTDHEDGLTRQELYDLIVLLFGGGYDTSKNLLNMIVNILLDRPDDWRRLASDEAFAKAIINETLRYASVITTYRIAREDIVYRDVTIPQGTMLVFPLPLAGRDASIFSNPNEFDPGRKPDARHFSLGRGIHICLGQFIARVQIEVALPIIASRLPDLARDGHVEWRPFPGVWGLKSLPVRTGKAA